MPDDVGPAHDGEHAVLVDGASGTENETPIPRGDYRQFYVQLRDALHGVGSNPVPPEQALPVTAVLETAVRSSAEGRALTLPLTEAEVLDFKR
jgi:predicted dehydrogenase